MKPDKGTWTHINIWTSLIYVLKVYNFPKLSENFFFWKTGKNPHLSMQTKFLVTSDVSVFARVKVQKVIKSKFKCWSSGVCSKSFLFIHVQYTIHNNFRTYSVSSTDSLSPKIFRLSRISKPLFFMLAQYSKVLVLLLL